MRAKNFDKTKAEQRLPNQVGNSWQVGRRAMWVVVKKVASGRMKAKNFAKYGGGGRARVEMSQEWTSSLDPATAVCH